MKVQNYDQFEAYLNKFYNFCFEQPSNNMIKELKILNINYGCSKKKNIYFKKKNEKISS